MNVSTFYRAWSAFAPPIFAHIWLLNRQRSIDVP
jgi:hypothetical protein